MAISMLKIRRPLGRLIFNMGIAIPGKTVFLIETAPWTSRQPRDRRQTSFLFKAIARGPYVCNFSQSTQPRHYICHNTGGKLFCCMLLSFAPLHSICWRSCRHVLWYIMMTSWHEHVSLPLAFVRGIHRSPVHSPHRGPIKRSFDFCRC